MMAVICVAVTAQYVRQISTTVKSTKLPPTYLVDPDFRPLCSTLLVAPLLAMIVS